MKKPARPTPIAVRPQRLRRARSAPSSGGTSLVDGLAVCRRRRKAVLAINIFSYDSFCSLATAFAAAKAPVIAQFSARFFKTTAPATVAQWRDIFHPRGVWLHLDHCEEERLVLECARAGFDSVMYDGSVAPLAENVERSAAIVRAVRRAAPGALVECEIGHVAGVEDGFGHDGPAGRVPRLDEVLAFHAEVRPDMLAVGFGNMHGHYNGREHFDLALMRRVGKALPGVPLVLHGGSGMALPVVRALVNHGHCKINISTDLKVAWMGGAREILAKAASPMEAVGALQAFQARFFADLHRKYASLLLST